MTSGRTGRSSVATASADPGAYSFTLPDAATLTLDAVGRPLFLHEKGFFLARGHDGRWLEKRWAAGAVPSRLVRVLPPGEARERDLRVRELLRALTDFSRRGRLVDVARPPASRKAWRLRLEALSDFQDRLARDVELFRSLYRPVSILPPDQYMAWVLQVVEGCAWNRCVFCDFFSGRPSRLRSPEEVRRHVEVSERYFGPALERRASIFLGDADAFAAPPKLLVSLCRWLARRHPRLTRPSEDGAWGIHAFGETRSLLAWPEKSLRALARTGFRRVTIGLESGDDGVRRWLKKPGRAADLRRAVERVKGAGLSVSLVTLLGAGGRPSHRAHRDGTARLLASLPLDEGDIVYLSPLKDRLGEPHSKALESAGRLPAEDVQVAEQSNVFRAAVAAHPEGCRPRVALYDVDEFLY